MGRTEDAAREREIEEQSPVPYQDCPNCGQRVPVVHEGGCLLGVFMRVLADRGHDLSNADLTKVWVDDMWDIFGGPGADWVAEQLGIPSYPPEEAPNRE